MYICTLLLVRVCTCTCTCIYFLFIHVAETDFSTTGTLNRDRTIQRQPSTNSSKLILIIHCVYVTGSGNIRFMVQNQILSSLFSHFVQEAY